MMEQLGRGFYILWQVTKAIPEAAIVWFSVGFCVATVAWALT